MKASDKQVQGTHYRDLSIQPAHYCYVNKLPNTASNIVKYATRAGNKGGREGMAADIRKIIHYAELWLEYEGFTDAPPVPAENVAIPPVRPSSGDGSTNGGMYRDLPRSACRTCGEDE